MRATRAYITGFGTTGLLIAAAFMTLFVMSAYVAFNGFPGQDVDDPIGTLLLQERQAPVSVPSQPEQVKVLGATRSARRTSHTVARRAIEPRAGVGPVKHRLPAQSAPAPESTPAPATSVQPAPLPQTGTQLPSGTPQLPSTQLPQLPSVNLPGVQAPTNSPQLPVDTGGVTKLIDGL